MFESYIHSVLYISGQTHDRQSQHISADENGSMAGLYNSEFIKK